MKLLDAVNLTLPKLGERPVTSLQIKHDTLAVLLPVIEQNLRKTLMRGWWFNEYATTLYPDVGGEIAVGQDTIEFIPDRSDTAVQRGTRLFNPVTLEYTFTEPVKGRVLQYVQFDDLPEAAAIFVFYESLVEAFATDMGVQQELGLWQSRAAQGWSDLVEAHLKHKKYNTRRSTAWRKYTAALRSY